MRKNRWPIAVLMLLVLGLAGCVDRTAERNAGEIAQSRAKKLMDTREDVRVVDVRTESEYAAGHIRGAVSLPLGRITDRGSVAKELPDRKQWLLIYCHSGRRARIAAGKLAGLGYTKVRSFGGITTWPYGLVTDQGGQKRSEESR
jgi:phage shock protein E